MKDNLLSLIVASVLGGGIALGGSYLLQDQTPFVPVVQQEAPTTPVVSSPPKLVNNYGLTGAPNSFADAAERAMPAVVNITSITQHQARTERERRYYQFFGSPGPSKSTGSGVIISDRGYIVTNNHVIKGATKVEVTLSDNRSYQAFLL